MITLSNASCRPTLFRIVRAHPAAFLLGLLLVSAAGLYATFYVLGDVWEVRARVLVKQGLAEPSPADSTARGFVVDVQPAADGGTLVSFTRRADRPAVDEVNAAAQAWLDAHARLVRQRRDALADQRRELQALSASVDNATTASRSASQALAAFEKTNKDDLASLEGSTGRLDALQKERDDLLRQTADTRARISEHEVTRTYLKGQLDKEQPFIEEKAVTVKPDPERVAMQRELDRMRIDLANMLKTYTEKHPDVKKLKEQIALKEKQLQTMSEQVTDSHESRTLPNPAYDDLKRRLVDAEVALQKARDQLTTQQGRLDTLQKSLDALRSLSKRHEALKQQAETAASTLQQLEHQRTEARQTLVSAEAATGAPGELRPATMPAAPVGPPRETLAGASVGLGLLTGLFFAGIASRASSTCRAPFELARAADVPVLGRISRI